MAQIFSVSQFVTHKLFGLCQHLNVLHTDLKIRFENILTLEISQGIFNPYDDIKESDVILQEELIGVSTNKELKVQFRNGYQQF